MYPQVTDTVLVSDPTGSKDYEYHGLGMGHPRIYEILDTFPGHDVESCRMHASYVLTTYGVLVL